MSIFCVSSSSSSTRRCEAALLLRRPRSARSARARAARAVRPRRRRRAPARAASGRAPTPARTPTSTCGPCLLRSADRAKAPCRNRDGDVDSRAPGFTKSPRRRGPCLHARVTRLPRSAHMNVDALSRGPRKQRRCSPSEPSCSCCSPFSPPPPFAQAAAPAAEGSLVGRVFDSVSGAGLEGVTVTRERAGRGDADQRRGRRLRDPGAAGRPLSHPLREGRLPAVHDDRLRSGRGPAESRGLPAAAAARRRPSPTSRTSRSSW